MTPPVYTEVLYSGVVSAGAGTLSDGPAAGTQWIITDIRAMSQEFAAVPIIGLTLSCLDSVPWAAWRLPGVRSQYLYSWSGRQVVYYADNILYTAGEAWTIRITGYVLTTP